MKVPLALGAAALLEVVVPLLLHGFFFALALDKGRESVVDFVVDFMHVADMGVVVTPSDAMVVGVGNASNHGAVVVRGYLHLDMVT